ncbi:MAG: HNH endonuclease signature motif containing protein [Clostridiales bacterium]|nr:HNH endonuclease [Eubacteriales bacterium]MDH7566806.1 HNH endonuclease signature motif containing protein [Clostridiales bacterium]
MICSYCGVEFDKKAPLFENNFCSKEHFYRWNSKRISAYNREQNPMNKPGGVIEARLRRSLMLRDKGKGVTYRKLLGRHEHRIMAEEFFGIELTSNDIVHHINGNKRDNSPLNLQILSRSEHAKLHFKKGVVPMPSSNSRGAALLMEMG